MRRPTNARPALLLPAATWTALFFLVPLGMLVVYAFGQMNIVTFQISWGWTLDNFTRIGDDLYLQPIARSLFLSTVSTLLCLLLGFPVALWISRLTGWRQTVALLAVMVPFWSSFVVRTYALVNVLMSTCCFKSSGRWAKNWPLE